MARFLNDRLVTLPKFSSERSADPAPQAADSTAAPAIVPGQEPGQVADLLHKEQQRLRDETLRQELGELRRQRRELLARVDGVLDGLTRQQEALSAQSVDLHKMRTTLEAAPVELASRDVTSFRELRKSVETARILLARLGHAGADGTGDSGAGLEGASARALLRAGLLLGLPITAGLLAAALIVAWVLHAVFAG